MGIASTGTVKVSERKGPIPLNWPKASRDPSVHSPSERRRHANASHNLL
jgi:hypothetical protein